MSTTTIVVHDDFAVRYVSDTPFVMRAHHHTGNFTKRINAVLFIEDQPEEVRQYLTIEERQWSEEVEVPCDHNEWVWHSKGMMACTECGAVHPVECNPSPTGTHEWYMAGPRTGTELCAHCYEPKPGTPMPAWPEAVSDVRPS